MSIIKHMNIVKGITRIRDHDQKLANLFGNLFLEVGHTFDIMPCEGQPFYFLYSVDCQEKIMVSKIINKFERFPKVKGFRVSFDFIDFEKKPCSCYYFVIEKKDKSFEVPESEEGKYRKVICTNAIKEKEIKKEIGELVTKIDCTFIDTNFNNGVTYNVRYGELDTKFMIEIANIYGEIDLRNMFKHVQSHVRLSSSDLKRLIPEISFDCSSRMIIITFSNPTMRMKRPLNEPDLPVVKRQKIMPAQNIKMIDGKTFILHQDGSYKPYGKN